MRLLVNDVLLSIAVPEYRHPFAYECRRGADYRYYYAKPDGTWGHHDVAEDTDVRIGVLTESGQIVSFTPVPRIAAEMIVKPKPRAAYDAVFCFIMHQTVDGEPMSADGDEQEVLLRGATRFATVNGHEFLAYRRRKS